jgi:hypothetical protein
VSGSGGASVPSQTLESGAGFEKVLRPAVIEVLDDPLKAEFDAAKSELAEASGTVSGYTGTDPAERANLELKRDERVRALQDEDKRYQIAKDLADNLTIGWGFQKHRGFVRTRRQGARSARRERGGGFTGKSNT